MLKAKAEIANTPPAHHGAFDYGELARLGLSPDEVIDFSVNSNPYGPPPGVREAIAGTPLERYPDRECLALREKLAQKHNVRPENIVVGNGTAELLQLIALAFLERSQRVVIPAVTFSEYERVARIAGAVIQPLPKVPATNDALFTEKQIKQTATLFDRASLVFFCNPNNPDGAHLPPEWIVEHWAAKHPQTLFVIDEAYVNFMLQPQPVIVGDQPNVLVVRSLTKDYALAGLRLGYAVGHPDLIEAVARLRPAWNVNALAQAAGVVVLDQTEWLQETVTQLHVHKRDLRAGLNDLGFEPLLSAVHYFLVKVGQGATFRSRVLRHKIVVRDCASFGLPEYVRIATRTAADNHRLLAAIRDSL